MKYGTLPVNLGIVDLLCEEMMFYQYLPIKFPGIETTHYEKRLWCFGDLIYRICTNFSAIFGAEQYTASYIYLTAKRMYQQGHSSFNRLGYHADGFMTNDINYIWCDSNPTIFNSTDFRISMDESGSLVEMTDQALPENECHYLEKSLLRLDQFNIHKVDDQQRAGFRTFVKVSFSTDKYDLKGNSHNYLLDYNWPMRDREVARNVPQQIPDIS